MGQEREGDQHEELRGLVRDMLEAQLGAAAHEIGNTLSRVLMKHSVSESLPTFTANLRAELTLCEHSDRQISTALLHGMLSAATARH